MKRMVFFIAAVCMGVLYSCSAPSAGHKLSVPALFADHMVLQQDQKIAVWGSAQPGQAVDLRFRNQSISGTTDSEGHWLIHLEPEKAGGPDSLTILCGDERVVCHDILVGEVWLCSGQSNMEMPLMGFPPSALIMDSEEEIANADYPGIRMFTVKRDVDFNPKDDCTGNWQVCTPPAARYFSATAYFFGRMIHRELNVPVGLIHSSWGGTPVESWMDQKHLSAFTEFDSVLSKIVANQGQIRVLEAWLGKRPKLQVDDSKENKWAILDFKDEDAASPGFDDHEWNTMELPRLWETSDMGQFDGVVWFRRTVDLPENMLQKDLILELGPIDDMDVTYFNGVKIGETQKEGLWNTSRVYHIPGNLTKAGDNVLAVRVMDNQGGGGIYGTTGQMKIYAGDDSTIAVSTAGSWKYLPVAEYRGGTFYLFDLNSRNFYERPKLTVDLGPYTPTTLYNAMINPLVPYTIRGAIWYQGEANTGNPEQYTYLFPAMIRDWREVWGLGDFPFYFVQIAPFDYGSGIRSQALREAQMKALEVPNTGMAVTLDIGNPGNIHPANKQKVGHRLALWALAKNYGRNIVYSGPIYRSMNNKGNRIEVSFYYAEDGLTTLGKPLSHFQIAGQDRVFRTASAQIKGNSVVVSSPMVNEPVAVRYCWDNTSDASLFNKAGLPASSFRTDNWDK